MFELKFKVEIETREEPMNLVPARDQRAEDLEGAPAPAPAPPGTGRELGRCVVCMDAYADATFVHDDTGHTVRSDCGVGPGRCSVRCILADGSCDYIV